MKSYFEEKQEKESLETQIFVSQNREKWSRGRVTNVVMSSFKFIVNSMSVPFIIWLHSIHTTHMFKNMLTFLKANSTWKINDANKDFSI